MNLTPQQIEFASYYFDPKSETYSNALQSALRAGYTQETAENITGDMPKWLSQLKRMKWKEIKNIRAIHKKDNCWLNIYFIRDNLTGLIKIGIAENVKKRFGQIKCHCSSDELEHLGIITGGIKEIKEMEKEIHRVFKAFKHHGEWFKPNPIMNNFINEATWYV